MIERLKWTELKIWRLILYIWESLYVDDIWSFRNGCDLGGSGYGGRKEAWDLSSPAFRGARWLGGKESACQHRRRGFNPWVRKCQPILVFLPGKSHGQVSLGGYSPWGCKVRHNWAAKCVCTGADTHTHAHTHTREETEGTQPDRYTKSLTESLTGSHGQYDYNHYHCLYFMKELKYIKSLILLFLGDIIFDYTMPAFYACSLISLFAFTVEDIGNWLESSEIPMEPKDSLFSAHLVISKFVPIIWTLWELYLLSLVSALSFLHFPLVYKPIRTKCSKVFT